MQQGYATNISQSESEAKSTLRNANDKDSTRVYFA